MNNNESFRDDLAARLASVLPPEQLQALMGHAKPETTLIYAKLDTSDLQHTHQQIYA